MGAASGLHVHLAVRFMSGCRFFSLAFVNLLHVTFSMLLVMMMIALMNCIVYRSDVGRLQRRMCTTRVGLIFIFCFQLAVQSNCIVNIPSHKQIMLLAPKLTRRGVEEGTARPVSK